MKNYKGVFKRGKAVRIYKLKLCTFYIEFFKILPGCFLNRLCIYIYLWTMLALRDLKSNDIISLVFAQNWGWLTYDLSSILAHNISEIRVYKWRIKLYLISNKNPWDLRTICYFYCKRENAIRRCCVLGKRRGKRKK